MSSLSISELRPAGADLFEGADSLANEVRELSEAELQISGGGHGKGRKSNSSKSGSRKSGSRKSGSRKSGSRKGSGSSSSGGYGYGCRH